MKNTFTNQRGQMTIESLLLITIFLIVGLTTQRFIMSNGLIKNLIEGPWKHVQGMIENGVWATPEKGKPLHPSIRARHGSLEGNDPP